MYGSLTVKTMNMAAEIGYDIEKTQLQIPSPRNTGMVGNRQSFTNERKRRPKTSSLTSTAADEGEGKGKELSQKIIDIVERECSMEGGRQTSAQTWVERAQRLHHVHGNRRYPDDSRKSLIRAADGRWYCGTISVIRPSLFSRVS
jgi:tRNASer (uridine44-2'-O)-methyltransferase